MSLTKLQEQRGQLLSEARERLNQIDDNTDESRATELSEQHDAAMAELDKIDARIKREQDLANAEARQEQIERSMREQRRPNQPDNQAPAAGGTELSYDDVYKRYLSVGLNDLQPEERALMMENRAQAAGTDAAGGFTVPQGFSGEIDKAMAIWGPMWDADIVRELNTTSGNDIKWPTVDDTAKTGRIKAENAAVDDDGTDDVVFAEKTLNAYFYDTGMVRVPWELLADSAFDVSGLMNDLFGERLGRLANSVLTNGTGSSEPNGIVTASAEGKAAAGAAAITADEIIDLVHSVDPAYRASPKCRFQFNDSTLAYLRKLKDGDGNYLWQMGDVRVGEPSQVLGHSYSVNQAMADIGANAKPIIFGDHSRFIVRKVAGFSVLTLRERYAENFQVGMVGYKRFDSELLNSAAVKHLVNAAA